MDLPFLFEHTAVILFGLVVIHEMCGRMAGKSLHSANTVTRPAKGRRVLSTETVDTNWVGGPSRSCRCKLGGGSKPKAKLDNSCVLSGALSLPLSPSLSLSLPLSSSLFLSLPLSSSLSLSLPLSPSLRQSVFISIARCLRRALSHLRNLAHNRHKPLYRKCASLHRNAPLYGNGAYLYGKGAHVYGKGAFV